MTGVGLMRAGNAQIYGDNYSERLSSHHFFQGTPGFIDSPYGKWVQDYNPSGWGQGIGNDTHVFNSGSITSMRILIQASNHAMGYIDDVSLYECNADGTIKDQPPVNFKNYTVSASTIKGITEKTDLTAFKRGIAVADNAIVKVLNKDGSEISDNDYLGTNTKVEVYVNSVKTDTYTVIINEDVNGDGSIDLKDLTLINGYLLGRESIDGVYKTAGNFYDESDISLNDLVGIMAYVSNCGTISQNY
jgi:hypothetical protein